MSAFDGGVDEASAGGGASSASSARKGPVCRFFLQGTCRHGDACRFSHDASAPVGGGGRGYQGNGGAPGAGAGAPGGAGGMGAHVHGQAQGQGGPVVGGGAGFWPTPYKVSFPTGTPIFSIDVECIATSKLHNARSVAHLALVDEWCQPVCSIYVKQELPVASYMTPVTGLTEQLIAEHGIPLADALIRLRACLPASAVLVGQNIKKDVDWLNLVEGLDFASMVDLAALFRVWNQQRNSYTIFSQDHAAKCWLGLSDNRVHDAVTDASISMSLFNAYRHCQWDDNALRQMQMHTFTTTRTPSYSATHPDIDGCCLGHRKTCMCGAPFFVSS